MTPLFFIQNVGLGAGLAMDACAVSMSNGLNEPKMSLRKWLAIAATFGLFQALMPIIGYFAGHAFIDYIGDYIPWIALVLLCFLGGKMIIDGIKELREQKDQSAAEADTPSDNEGVTNRPETSEASIGEQTDGISDCGIGAAPDAPTVPDQDVLQSVETDNTGEAAQAAVSEQHSSHKLTVKTLFVQAIATSIDALSVGLSIANYSILEAFVAAFIIALVTFGICVAAVYIGKKFGDKLGSKAVIMGGVILVAIGLEICLTGVLG